ncbi:hypothetical protein LINPERHAP1_LOCUS24086 [Linum perenne]
MVKVRSAIWEEEGTASARTARVRPKEEIRTQKAKLKSFVVDLRYFQSILEFKRSSEKWLLDWICISSQLLINNVGIYLKLPCKDEANENAQETYRVAVRKYISWLEMESSCISSCHYCFTF